MVVIYPFYTVVYHPVIIVYLYTLNNQVFLGSCGILPGKWVNLQHLCAEGSGDDGGMMLETEDPQTMRSSCLLWSNSTIFDFVIFSVFV